VKRAKRALLRRTHRAASRGSSRSLAAQRTLAQDDNAPYPQAIRFDRLGGLLYNKKFGLTPNISLQNEGNEPVMANHHSALKRARQTIKRTAVNRANTSTLRTQLRDLRETIEKGDKAAAQESYRKTVSALDKGIQKGLLHENTASRYKSRLGKRVAAIK
jgi:small subunit ribosomal protein S20